MFVVEKRGLLGAGALDVCDADLEMDSFGRLTVNEL
jgi:hypothetical protein